ncbi:gpi inositol deacylase pgap1, putative [Ixodes scapularis]|uniref:GPI inositol-deacylase n=1 Tax=Ixodes scapularis TaxID=6945 RepID=B7PY84_IXOSC|nr:gpi inositol deacylase pgap1, putative [Ixodes scapularis]|eukprot:XP_002402680.1 gpi inositol deacylase pgap1, putative [Ixodes scapularis]
MPVLFVPGNAGSYQQVRSIGSVLFRKADFQRLPHHFDVFAVDFRDELSGLYGGHLAEQTDFLHECVKKIRHLYRSTNASLVILGHSMGGVVARALFTLPQFDAASVSLIFTYATPHKTAAVLDSHLQSFYGRLHETWSRDRGKFTDLTVVSIGGGDRDVLVRTELTTLPAHEGDVSATSTAVPAVWASTDHLSIVWCQQLVVVTARALYDLVVKGQNRLTTDPELIREVVRFHFVRQPYGKQLPQHAPPELVRFGQGGEWSEKLEASWRFRKNKVLSVQSVVMPFYDNESIVVVETGLLTTDPDLIREVVRFHFVRQPYGKQLPQHAPPELVRFGQGGEWSEKLEASWRFRKNKVVVVGERYKRSLRTRRLEVPSALSSFFGPPPTLLSVPLTEGAAFYNLTLSGFRHLWQAYDVTLASKVCRAGTKGEGIVRFVVPWSQEDRFFSIKYPQSKLSRAQTEMPLKIQNPLSEEDSRRFPGVQLHLYLDPECNYVMTAQFSFQRALGQAVKRYITMVPAYLVALMLAALSAQLCSISDTGLCLPFDRALNLASTFPALVLLPAFFECILWPLVSMVWPEPDNAGSSGFLENLALRTGLYSAAYGLTATLGLAFTGVVVLSGHLLTKVETINRYQTKPLPAPKDMSWSKSTLSVVLVLFVVAILTATAVSLVLGYLIYGFKVALLCGQQRMLEDRRGKSGPTSGWRLHVTILMLWACVMLVAMPSFLVWARGLGFFLRLADDPHLAYTAAILAASGVVWQAGVPLTHRFYYKASHCCIYGMAVLTVLYSTVTLYRIAYAASAAHAALALQQALGRDSSVKTV